MSVRDAIVRETKEAMKGRDKPRVEALRMLIAALKNAEIDKGASLTEEEEMVILRRQLKQREESAEAFRKGGREYQAQAEMSEAMAKTRDKDLRRFVQKTGASTMKDMGVVMNQATKRAGDRADGRRLATLVRGRLQN